MPKEVFQQSFLQGVGSRINTLRQARGYTLADLGENIGLDKSNTFRLEQGKNFTLLTLVKIAAFFNVHPHEILNVPFQVDFVKIETAIAEKKKTRKINSSREKNHSAKLVVTEYTQPSETSDLAAEAEIPMKKKKNS